MREYTKLMIVAIFASAITFGATQLLQSEPVQAAPAADALPPDFKKGMAVDIGDVTGGGTVVQTHGNWVELTDGETKWWIDATNPGKWWQFTKGE
jgi:hypothetical protein